MSNAEESLPPGGASLQLALQALVKALETRSINYAIIGGIATIQHGRVRTTDDIDVLLNVSQIAMPALFEGLKLEGFVADERENTIQLRDDGMTSIQFRDVLVDILRPVLPVYTHVLDRAKTEQLAGQSVRISSVECLIVMKLLALRPQDIADIEELCIAHHGELDVAFIHEELATVTEPTDPRWQTLNALLPIKTSGT